MSVFAFDKNFHLLHAFNISAHKIRVVIINVFFIYLPLNL